MDDMTRAFVELIRRAATDLPAIPPLFARIPACLSFTSFTPRK
jgi:hypothetical protein